MPGPSSQESCRIPFCWGIALTLLGVAGNYFSIPLFYGVDFLFGSIFTLLAVRFLGLTWGTVSVIFASSYTYVLWNHPYGAMIFVAEILFVGGFLRKKQSNLLLLDGIFWAAIGMPLVWIFYTFGLGLDATFVKLIMFKQGVNGIFNAVIASVIATAADMAIARKNPQYKRETSVEKGLLVFSAAFILIPALILIVLDSRREKDRVDQWIKQEVDIITENFQSQMRVWHERHLLALHRVALMTSRTDLQPSEDLQRKLEFYTETFSDFHAIYVADETGTTVAFYPPVNEQGESTIGLNFSDRSYYKLIKETLQPLLSDVFIARGGIVSPIQALGVPILKGGKLSGLVMAALNLECIENLLHRYDNIEATDLILTDSKGKIIATTIYDLDALETPSWLTEGKMVPVADGLLHWQPDRGNLSTMALWQQSFYFKQTTVGENLPWRFGVRIAVAPFQEAIYQTYITNFGVAFFIAVFTFLVTPFISRRFSRSVSNLAQITTCLPENITNKSQINWPKSSLAEISSLIKNFQRMAEVLSQNFDALTQKTRALATSENYSKNIIDSSLDMIITTDNHRRIVEFNTAAQNTFGYSLEEVRGKHISMLYASEEEGNNVYESVMYDGPAVQRISNRRKNGEIFISQLSTSKLFNTEGEQIGIMGISRDITDQQRMEQALKDSDERFRTIFETSALGIVIVDTDGVLVQTNNAFQTMLGYTDGELRGRHFSEITHPEDVAMGRALLERTKSQGNENLWLEKRYLTQDGEIRWGHIVITPIRDGARQLRYCVVMIEDITEKREFEEHISQQDRLAAVGHLAAGIAHDFNNLLTVMMGTAQIIEMKQDEMSDDLKEDLDNIFQQGRRAANLVKQILDFSRKTVAERHPVDLVPFVKESVKMLERTLPEHIEIHTRYDEDGYMVNANLTQLQQVLTNLAVNARDAMTNGGDLTIEISSLEIKNGDFSPLPNMEPGTWVVWKISDTGMGMSAGVKKHIFEPFFTTKQPGEGTGLGLAQVYGIVKQHGGEIKVDSKPGQGTTFTVYLLKVEAADAHQVPDVITVPTGNGETVLVVEDDAAVLEIVTRMLKELNYKVVSARNGAEALEHFNQMNHEISLVLTDMVMPEVGGRELVLKLTEEASDLKIIIMTGYSPDTSVGSDMLRLASGILEKPIERDALAQMLKNALTERG